MNEPKLDTTPLKAEELEALVPRSKDEAQSEGSHKLSQRDFRALAFYFLYALEQCDYELSLGAVVDNFRRGFDIDIEDNSFASTMARGVIENRHMLDAQIEPYLKNWKMERLGFCTRLILRMAFWELSQKDAIPRIVINEAIELAKAFSEKDAYKFVNGVLDQHAKEMHKGNESVKQQA